MTTFLKPAEVLDVFQVTEDNVNTGPPDWINPIRPSFGGVPGKISVREGSGHWAYNDPILREGNLDDYLLRIRDWQGERVIVMTPEEYDKWVFDREYICKCGQRVAPHRCGDADVGF